MLIYIDESCADYFRGNILNPTDKEVIKFSDILRTVRKKTNLVYASFSTLEKLKKIEYFDNEILNIIHFLIKKIQDINNIAKLIENSIIIYHEKSKTNKKGIYFDIANTNKNFDSSVFVTENLSDNKFYIGICNAYYNKKHSNIMKIEFNNKHGGGSDISSVIKDEVKSDNFVLSIVDSDKKYKNDSIGINAKKSLSHHDFENGISVLIIDDVKEKENLISPNIYKKLGLNTCITRSFYDLKLSNSKQYFLRYCYLSRDLRKDHSDEIELKIEGIELDDYREAINMIIKNRNNKTIYNQKNVEIIYKHNTKNVLRKLNKKLHSWPPISINFEGETSNNEEEYILASYLKNTWIKIFEKIILFGASNNVDVLNA